MIFGPTVNIEKREVRGMLVSDFGKLRWKNYREVGQGKRVN